MRNDDEDIGVGPPNPGECGESGVDDYAPITKEGILAELDRRLEDSGGAYSADKMPIDTAIRYSLIALNAETAKKLNALVGVLAGSVVGRVQYCEEAINRLASPFKRTIRGRIKAQENSISSLIGVLSNCICARTAYCQQMLADCQCKMLGADATVPETPTADIPTGTESVPEEDISGYPTPTTLGLSKPTESNTYTATAKDCVYIDLCHKEYYSGWWYYWWAWAVWWWGWFRWYLRAWWACYAAKCGLPAQPYSIEGQTFIVNLEQGRATLPETGEGRTAIPAIAPSGPMLPSGELPIIPEGLEIVPPPESGVV